MVRVAWCSITDRMGWSERSSELSDGATNRRERMSKEEQELFILTLCFLKKVICHLEKFNRKMFYHYRCEKRSSMILHKMS